jgi:hypothetical protein
MQDLFPTITPGMIITKVQHADTEELGFDDVLVLLRAAKLPHVLEFRRYDFEQDVVSGEWVSLQELRVAGRFIVDPRVRRHHFVESGRRGDFANLKAALKRGEDPNSTDSTNCTGEGIFIAET